MLEPVLFDVSRLLSRTDRSAPTGVDRVCLAYAEWLMSRPDILMVPVRSRHDRLVAVDGVWFRTCVTDLRRRWTGAGAGEDARRTAALFEAVRAERPLDRSVACAPPQDEATTGSSRQTRPWRVWQQFMASRHMPDLPTSRHYINVGHTSLNTPDILQGLSKKGVERTILLHDLIPITHPEFCRPGDGDRHRARVLNTLRHATRILVNSEYTAGELTRFAAREGVTAPPIQAVHLGLEPVFRPSAEDRTPRPYFVHVGTIEARKNLAFLLTIWRRLHERLGEAAPQLVLIGRYGWENEAVLDHLQRSPNLQGLVHQCENLPDAALARLMSGARAILAPSSVEGFDLPAVEACALGVPLIASDIPAHRELVPDAHLIDPLDGLGWLEAIERACDAPPVAPDYRAPSWRAHFAEVSRFTGLGRTPL